MLESTAAVGLSLGVSRKCLQAGGAYILRGHSTASNRGWRKHGNEIPLAILRNVRGEVRVNFLVVFALKPDIFMCGAVRLNVALPSPFWLLLRINQVRMKQQHPTYQNKKRIAKTMTAKEKISARVSQQMPSKQFISCWSKESFKWGGGWCCASCGKWGTPLC